MQFGDVLRGLLEEAEITQKQLAAELNLLPATLGRYIRNEREPDIETIKRSRTFSHIEDDVLRIFRSMTSEQQVIYMEQGKAIVRLNQKDEKAKSS